jgi:hypothetical protein
MVSSKRRVVTEEIHRLVEESAITRERGNLREALEKGKEAGKKDRLDYGIFYWDNHGTINSGS